MDGQDALKIVAESSLGILREKRRQATSRRASRRCRRKSARTRGGPELLVITKSTARSTVHRPGYLDYIAVKRFDEAGNVIGEDRFLGLFTSTAYSANPPDIPLLRRKVANVVARAGLAPGSHAGKALLNILATYPRDELFQTGEEDLLRTAMGILHLYDRQRFRLFVRRDPFERFLSCLIYAPREVYSTDMRQKWQAILIQAFNGTSSEFNREPLGVGARAHPHHRAHDAGRHSRVRRARAGGAAVQRGATLDRRPEGRRWSRRWARRVGTSASASSPTRFPPATARNFRRATRFPTSR